MLAVINGTYRVSNGQSQKVEPIDSMETGEILSPRWRCARLRPPLLLLLLLLRHYRSCCGGGGRRRLFMGPINRRSVQCAQRVVRISRANCKQRRQSARQLNLHNLIEEGESLSPSSPLLLLPSKLLFACNGLDLGVALATRNGDRNLSRRRCRCQCQCSARERERPQI